MSVMTVMSAWPPCVQIPPHRGRSRGHLRSCLVNFGDITNRNVRSSCRDPHLRRTRRNTPPKTERGRQGEDAAVRAGALEDEARSRERWRARTRRSRSCWSGRAARPPTPARRPGCARGTRRSRTSACTARARAGRPRARARAPRVGRARALRAGTPRAGATTRRIMRRRTARRDQPRASSASRRAPPRGRCGRHREPRHGAQADAPRPRSRPCSRGV